MVRVRLYGLLSCMLRLPHVCLFSAFCNRRNKTKRSWRNEIDRMKLTKLVSCNRRNKTDETKLVSFNLRNWREEATIDHTQLFECWITTLNQHWIKHNVFRLPGWDICQHHAAFRPRQRRWTNINSPYNSLLGSSSFFSVMLAQHWNDVRCDWPIIRPHHL